MEFSINMKKDRLFKVSKELRPYLEKVLERDNVNYCYRKDKIKVPLSSNNFHKKILRAKCEKLNYEKGLSEEETYYISKAESIKELGKYGYLTYREYPSNN